MKISGKQIFLGGVCTVVGVVIIGGFFLAGAPSKERARRFDTQRVNDLQSLASAIDQVYNSSTNGGKLPKSLDELKTRRDVYVSSLLDPESNEAYEYEATGDTTYKLCANFKTDGTSIDTANNPRGIYPAPVGGTDFWSHPIGKKCFDVTVQVWAKP